jgi:hypothetical protein
VEPHFGAIVEGLEALNIDALQFEQGHAPSYIDVLGG